MVHTVSVTVFRMIRFHRACDQRHGPQEGISLMKRIRHALAISLLSAPTAVLAQDVDSLALALSNPTAATTALANVFDFTTYKGSTPGADDQTSWTYLLQPPFPFQLANGSNILFRPAIPIIFDVPVATGGGFEGSGVKFGDIAYDLAYGRTTAGGTLLLGGLTGSFPTGGEGVSSDQVTLGPEVALGIIRRWGVVGFLAFQRWGVTGDKDVNTLGIQYFYAYGLGGGWQISAAPIVTFNKDAEDGNKWAIPIGAGISKTSIAGTTPFKIAIQVWKYVEKPDAFGADWTIRFSIAPVITLPWGR